MRTSVPPTIDGRLDDAVWQDAEVITDIQQVRPAEGVQPSEPTEVYVLYDDDDAFYIGARMFDSEPDRIAAPTMRHGQGLGSDDRLVVIFDPFNTGAAAVTASRRTPTQSGTTRCIRTSPVSRPHGA